MIYFIILGFIVYFYYGIKHSTLEEEVDQNIELTVTDHEKVETFTTQPQFSPSPASAYEYNR